MLLSPLSIFGIGLIVGGLWSLLFEQSSTSLELMALTESMNNYSVHSFPTLFLTQLNALLYCTLHLPVRSLPQNYYSLLVIIFSAYARNPSAPRVYQANKSSLETYLNAFNSHADLTQEGFSAEKLPKRVIVNVYKQRCPGSYLY